MQILVTGGAGFIGSHLAERFVEEGHDIVVLDNLNEFYDTGLKERNVTAGREKTEEGGTYEFVEGDIRNEALVDELVAETDFVFRSCVARC